MSSGNDVEYWGYNDTESLEIGTKCAKSDCDDNYNDDGDDDYNFAFIEQTSSPIAFRCYTSPSIH